MSDSGIPAALKENRDDERSVFFLINWLRRQVIAANAIGGSLLFSNPMEALVGSSSGNEDVVEQFELPTALASFNLIFYGMMRSATGTGHAYVRLGGGDRVADGTVIATLTCPAATYPAYARFSATGTISNPTLATRMKITVRSSAAASLTQIKDHGVVGN